VVDVTDRADVDVRFAAIEFLFGHLELTSLFYRLVVVVDQTR
jgi:hypothetical protein